MTIVITVIRIVVGMLIIGVGLASIITGFSPILGIPALISLPIMSTFHAFDKIAPFFNVSTSTLDMLISFIAGGLFMSLLSSFFGRIMSGGGTMLFGLLTTGLVNQSAADSILMIIGAPMLALAIPIIIVVLIFR